MLETRERPGGREEPQVGGPHCTVLRSRAIIGLGLVAAGVVWALFRGLRFYGLTPVDLAWDLDQPPWLLLLVSGWLVYRSRRR